MVSVVSVDSVDSVLSVVSVDSVDSADSVVTMECTQSMESMYIHGICGHAWISMEWNPLCIFLFAYATLQRECRSTFHAR